jgi:hypothetical protein
MADFRGRKRSNATHESSTDPQAKFMRKDNAQAVKLTYGGHALMDNRSGLWLDIEVSRAIDTIYRTRIHMGLKDHLSDSKMAIHSSPSVDIALAPQCIM